MLQDLYIIYEILLHIFYSRTRRQRFSAFVHMRLQKIIMIQRSCIYIGVYNNTISYKRVKRQPGGRVQSAKVYF